MLFEGRGQGLARLDGAARALQGRLHARRDHRLHGGNCLHDGDAALGQHAQGQVQARQFIDAHALADARQLRQQARHAAMAQHAPHGHEHRAAGERQPEQQQHAVFGDELAPAEHDLRHPRQVAPRALVDLGEARHHIADQEGADAAAHGQQDGRINGGADDFTAHRIDALLVVDVARQGARQVAGAFGRLDDADIQGGKQFGLLRQHGGKTLAFAQAFQQTREHAARGRRRFLFQQGFQRFDDAQTRIQ